ncbi:MAG TPA: gamma-glutamyltransferase, partial [Spirochaetia bacterium]|nr:gamma-glutamyltransferase [Spirochaetia bacterium]
MKKLFSVFVLVAFAAALIAAQTPVNLYGRAAQGAKGVVAAAKPEASQVGIDILKKGGNAVDAAIATAFALGVLEPNASGIGGGGFMVIKMANMKEAVVIDFRETAPAAAKPDMFKFGEDGKVIDNASVVGGLSVGVPGEVAGLLYALENYGSKKMNREKVLAPAVEWAEKGIPVTVNLASIIQSELGKINKYPATAKIYTKDGLPYELGETIKNPDLAATLRAIAKDGKDAIYKGEMAERIAKAARDAGGILTAADLANYQVKIRKPVTGTYRGYTIVSVPPASSGGT